MSCGECDVVERGDTRVTPSRSLSHRKEESTRPFELGVPSPTRNTNNTNGTGGCAGVCVVGVCLRMGCGSHALKHPPADTADQGSEMEEEM